MKEKIIFIIAGIIMCILLIIVIIAAKQDYKAKCNLVKELGLDSFKAEDIRAENILMCRRMGIDITPQKNKRERE